MNTSIPREIRFIDRFYNTLFMLPDGENIILTDSMGRASVLSCQYVDPCCAVIGHNTYHICQFAEIQEGKGRVYRPEHPRENDICDTYSVYRPKLHLYPRGHVTYESAKAELYVSNYKKVYTSVLAPNITLETLFAKHTSFTDFNWIPSIQATNVIVLNRAGRERAYFVDQPTSLYLFFREAKQFLGLLVYPYRN